MTIIDNGLEAIKQPQHRVFSDIFTQRMSDSTRKHRTKILALSVGILYLKFSNIELVQLGFIRFTSTSASPMPLLIAALGYFFFYFAIGSILDYRKYIACKRFEVWDKFEEGFHYIKRKMESNEYIENINTQGHIKEFISKVDNEYTEATKIRRLESLFYWVWECGLPVSLSLGVVLQLCHVF